MAERHFINGGVNNNWGTIGNWSLTEGGAGGQSVPSASDDVFLDTGSPSCILDNTNKVAKTLTASAYTGTLTFSNALSVSGNITIGANMKFAGESRLLMIAAGTWTTNGKTIPQSITIGGFASGTVTLAGALTTSGDLLLSNMTSTTFSGDFHITAATCTISGAQTVTLVHDVTITGLTTIADTNVIDGAFNWNTGGLTTTGSLTGTATIVLTGGTWTGAAGTLSNNLTFAGDVIVSGTVKYAASGTPTITYSSGTITTTDSILSIAAACTLATNGMSWANITLTLALTLTINSLLTATGTLTIPNAAITFNGTAGFTVGTLTHTALATTSRIFTFEEGITYTITDAMTATHGAVQGYRYTYTSADANIRAIITLGYGATQNIGFLDPTRIDSSLGQAIFSFRGVFTDSLNWSNDLGHGRIIPEAGGESVTVAGITKDNSGVALGSCDVYLFRDNGGDTATYIAYQESNSVTGAYSFAVFPGSTR